jgi:hypothetical protein
MEAVDYPAVIAVLRPSASWVLDGSEYAGLTWLDDSPKPTKKTLDDAWPQVQYDRDHAYIEAARRARYQAETDGIYFEAVRGDGNLDAWKAATAQIRADLPYPEAP